MKPSEQFEPPSDPLDSLQSFRLSSSPLKITQKIESLESRLSKSKLKLSCPLDPESISTINQLGLLYIKQGLLSFQQLKYEKSESYFSKAQSLLKEIPMKRSDPFLFIEINLIQTRSYIYKTLNKEENAFLELTKFFDRNLAPDMLASKSELISAGIELIYIMYAGMALKNGQKEQGIHAVTQGIEYLQCFLRTHPWSKIMPQNRETIISQRKGNLAYLYYLGSRFHAEKHASTKSLEEALAFITKAISISREVHGEQAIATIKYQKHMEILKKRLNFEKNLISDLPSSFDDFLHGLPNEGNTSKTHYDNSMEIPFQTMRSTPNNAKKATAKFTRFQKRNVVNPKNYPLRVTLHRRNLTTCSSSTNNTFTGTPKTLVLNIISPHELSEFHNNNNRTISLTKRPNTSKHSEERTVSFPILTATTQQPPVTTPHNNKKPLIAQTSFKTVTSLSSDRKTTVHSPEITSPSRILKGQFLKHSISLKKPPDLLNKKPRLRRHSEVPFPLSEEKRGLSIFAVQNEIEEENLSIMDSLSEKSDSGHCIPSLENSTPKVRSSIRETPKNDLLSLDTNSVRNPKDAVVTSKSTALIKKQTLEIPSLNRSRSKEGGSFSEKSSQSVIIEEGARPGSEIQRVRTEIIEGNVGTGYSGNATSKSNNELDPNAKFVNKVFKSLMLRKFNKFNPQKIKEIEDNDSPIMKAIDDMNISIGKSTASYSKLTFGDTFIEEKLFPVKFWGEKGEICEILSFEILLMRDFNRRSASGEVTTASQSLIPLGWVLITKVIYRDGRLNLGSVFGSKSVNEIETEEEKIKGLGLGLRILKENIMKNAKNRDLLEILIEIIRENIRNSNVLRTTVGKILINNDSSVKKIKIIEENDSFIDKKMKKKHENTRKIAIYREISIKNYLKVWGMDKIIINPDVSHEFSLFFENFNEKLPKFNDLSQIFAHNRKPPSLTRRAMSLKSIKFKTNLNGSPFVDANSNNNTEKKENNEITPNNKISIEKFIKETEISEKNEENSPKKTENSSKKKSENSVKKSENSVKKSENSFKKSENSFKKSENSYKNPENLDFFDKIPEENLEKPQNITNIVPSKSIFEKKESSKTLSFQSSTPGLKDRDAISSIRDIPISGSQNSFISREKKLLALMPSLPGSLRFSDQNPVSTKEFPMPPPTFKMPLESSPDFSNELELNKASMGQINLIKANSPRRKTMQYYAKNPNIPTIQSLFNLEDLEGSPHKIIVGSPKQGFEMLLNSKRDSLNLTESRKNEGFLANNLEFVERFFKEKEGENKKKSRYEKRMVGFGKSTGVFVERPVNLEEPKEDLVRLPIGNERVFIAFAKKERTLVEIRVFNRKNTGQLCFSVPRADFKEFLFNDSIGMYFLIPGNAVPIGERAFLDFFKEILKIEENDEILNELLFLMKYKVFRKKLSLKIRETVNNSAFFDEKHLISFKFPQQKPSKKPNKSLIKIQKKLFFLSKFNKINKSPAKTSQNKVYLKFHLKNSIKYLRIERLPDFEMRLAFYDPLQGRKDYCLLHQDAELSNVDRLLHQRNSRLKEHILSQNLTYIQELVGKKLYIFRENRTNTKQKQQEKSSINNMKLILFSQIEHETLKNFFLKQVLYEVYKIRNLGKSYIKLTIYKPNRHFNVGFRGDDAGLFKLEIYPFNKRFSLQKLIFSNKDFPGTALLDNERAVLTFLNHSVLNKLAYIRSMLYKKLVLPKNDPKYPKISFAEEVKFEKFQEENAKNAGFSEENAKISEKFLTLLCIPYKIYFQCVKKISKFFGILTFKKHLILGYWVIEIYFPSTNRTLKCFIRPVDGCFRDLEASFTVKSWNSLMKRIKFLRTNNKYLMIIDNFRGIIRETIVEDVISNVHNGLIMTEWIIEKTGENNCLRIFPKCDVHTSKRYVVFLKIHFLTENAIFDEKISLRELMYSYTEFRKMPVFRHCDILKIVKFYSKNLNNNLKMASDLRFFKEKAFKTRFIEEDLAFKPNIRFNKDRRLAGFYEKKSVILLEKVLTIRPRQMVGVLWMVREREFLVVVLKSSECRKEVWRVGIGDVRERVSCIESLMELGLWVEAGERVLAIARNKILIAGLGK